MGKVVKGVAMAALLIPSTLLALVVTALCVFSCLFIIGFFITPIVVPLVWMLPVGVLAMFGHKELAAANEQFEADRADRIDSLRTFPQVDRTA